MVWIIVISVFVFITLLGLVIFSWRNAKRSIKPTVIETGREIEWNKNKGLWLDFDSCNKTEYEVEGKDGYILHVMCADTSDTRGTGRYVIICHGHTSSRFGAVKYANSYLKLGFTCIMYDARCHGSNAPDICTLGNIESLDLAKVIADTRKRFTDLKVLGLHGESMGSSTVLIETSMDPPVDFIVADCGFTSCFDVIHEGYGNIHLGFLAHPVNLAGKILYKVDLKKTCALKALENNHYPVLFIHGAGDTFIKPHHSKKMYEAARKNGAHCELILVDGAGHASSRLVAGFDAYTGYIGKFLKDIGIL